MPRVLCIGDSSINVFLQIPASAENVNVDEVDRKMNFRLGSKTQLEKEVVTFGGNALNVAIGLARQGIETGLYSIIGNDTDGERVVQFLFKENEEMALRFYGSMVQDNTEGRIDRTMINTTNVKQQSVKTNVGYVINFRGERFLLIDTSEKSYSFSSTNYQLQTTDWLFLSSVGPNYEDFFKQLLELKKEKGFKLAYNPSSNELKKDVETYIEMVKASDILFVNKKEATKILTNPINSPNNSSNLSSNSIGINPLAIRMNPSPEVQALLQKLQSLTNKVVVITDGIRGSYVYDGKQSYFEPSSQAPAKEKTGAGDAYESGFLAEYLKTGDIQAAMKNGTDNAGSVIQYVGAIEGLQYKI